MTMIKTMRPLTDYDMRRAERIYARSSIFTSWVICALLTAVFAWTLRQEPFALPPLAIQASALLINALCWWLCTTRIWFKLDNPSRSAARRLREALQSLKTALEYNRRK